VGTDSADRAVGLFPVRYDDDGDNKDDDDFAAFFVNCSFSLFLLFINALFALCAFFTSSFFFFFMLFVEVVVAVGAVAPASKKPVPPGYSPFRNLVL
jgi:hypothetical protein